MVADGDNRATVERYVEAFFAPNDLDALESTLATDVQVVQVHDGLIARVNAYFAASFEAPDWRAPYREPTER